MNIEKDVLERRSEVLHHRDNISANVERTQAILSLVTCEFIDGCEPKGLNNGQIANLLWQVEENIRLLKSETDALWEKMKQGKQ